MFEDGHQLRMLFPTVLTLVIGLFKIVSAEAEDNGPVVQLNGKNFDQVQSVLKIPTNNPLVCWR